MLQFARAGRRGRRRRGLERPANRVDLGDRELPGKRRAVRALAEGRRGRSRPHPGRTASSAGSSRHHPASTRPAARVGAAARARDRDIGDLRGRRPEEADLRQIGGVHRVGRRGDRHGAVGERRGPVERRAVCSAGAACAPAAAIGPGPSASAPANGRGSHDPASAHPPWRDGMHAPILAAHAARRRRFRAASCNS